MTDQERPKVKRWLKFEEDAPPAWSKRKTKVLDVGSLKTNEYLGRIEFYPGWRQYIFIGALGDTFWAADCLREIADKIDGLDTERKARLKTVRE